MSKPTPAHLVTLSKDYDEDFSNFVQFVNEYCLETVSHNLLGRLLTLIDASMPANGQTEALKSLIKQECYAAYDDIWRANCKLDLDYIITPIVKESTNPTHS